MEVKSNASKGKHGTIKATEIGGTHVDEQYSSKVHVKSNTELHIFSLTL
jgi:hypothetical protein